MKAEADFKEKMATNFDTVREAFRRFDKDHSCGVSASELSALLDEINMPLEKEVMFYSN